MRPRDWQRYARKGTTTQRGYGSAHQKKLRQALANWKRGQPCAQCGQPIWCIYALIWQDGITRKISTVDLGHTPDRSGYIGLTHRSCNRSEGAIRGNKTRGQAKRWYQSRIW